MQNLRTTSLGQNLLVLTKKNRLFGETSHCFQTNCSWSVVCPNVILTGRAYNMHGPTLYGVLQFTTRLNAVVLHVQSFL